MFEISRERHLTAEGFSTLMDRVGRSADIRAARTIVIKPNLTGRATTPGSHIMTDPRLLRDVVVALLAMNANASVLIAESDSRGYVFAYSKFEGLGLPGSLNLDGADRVRVSLLDLSRDRLMQVHNGNFRYFTDVRSLWLSETLMNADFIVSLANCKTHNLAGFTGTCKNLFGCLPHFDKSPYHPRIHDVVHDVTLAIAPQLSIVDAFAAMEGNGPILGHAVDLGFRAFSSDAIEADVCAACSVGIAPEGVPYLRHLQATRQCDIGPSDYPLIGRLAPPSASRRVTRRIGVGVQGLGHATVRLGQRVEHSRHGAEIVPALARRALHAARERVLRRDR